MKSDRTAGLAVLCDRLGHRFKDEALLVEALTHSSAITRARQANYQRLEFIGDRVLALVVADLLFRRFPAENEGQLARRLNELVRLETCAEVARELGIAPFLVLGSGEKRAGGSDKPAILGDVCEALIGALFRDGGIDVARRFIERYWENRIAAAAVPRDAKTALQEWAQGRGLPAPAYQLESRSGADHAPHFTISVSVIGQGAAEGSGSSKRAAEQQAAGALLMRLESEDHGKG